VSYRSTPIAFAAAALVSVAPAFAQVASYGEALRLAYRQNDTLEIDRLGLDALKTDLAIARTGYLPTLLAEGSVQRTELDIENTGYQAGLRLNQPVFDGFRTRSAMRAARANIDAGEASLEVTENDVLRAVTAAYANVRLGREVEALYADLETGLRTQRDAEARRLQAGERTRTDVAQSEARLSDASAGLARARAELQVAEQEFTRLIGAPPAGRIGPIAIPVPLPQSLDEALRLARDNNPVIEQLRRTADFADAQVGISRSALLPKVGVEARVLYRDQVFEFTGVEIEQTLGTVAATLQVPLYQAGGARAQLQRAKKVRKLRQFEVTEAIRDVEIDVVAAWRSYEALQFQLAASEQSVAANLQAVEGMRTEAGFGTRSTIDVLDAERDLNASRIQFAETERDLKMAAVDLLVSIGLFTASDLDIAQ
jgi:TolC family type I secretion outer membrane protein